MGLRENESIDNQSSAFSVAWQHYGFTQMPFMTHLQYAMLYCPEQWMQLFSRAKNFLGSPNRLLLLTGERQVGKTTFMHYFSNSFALDCQRAVLTGNKGLLPSDLNRHLLQQFQLHLTEGGAEHQLNSIIAMMKIHKKSYLIVVDDAMFLPVPTLAALLHLTMACATDLSLHIILVGENDLANRIAILLARDASSLAIQRLRLVPFSKQDVYHYLIYRLKKSGLHSNYSLREAAVRKIVQLSGGVVGRINDSAQAFLEQNNLLVSMRESDKFIQKQKSPFQAEAANRSNFNWLQPVVMTCLLVFCFGVWHYQDRISDDLTSADSVVPVSHQTSTDALLQFLPSIKTADKSVSAAFQPAKYTVELSENRDEDLIQQLRRQYHLEQLTKVGYVQLNNQHEYVLTYGEYQNLQDAQAEITKLPIVLREMKPVIRSTKNIEWMV